MLFLLKIKLFTPKSSSHLEPRRIWGKSSMLKLAALPLYPEAAHGSPDEPSSAACSPLAGYKHFLQETYFNTA